MTMGKRILGIMAAAAMAVQGMAAVRAAALPAEVIGVTWEWLSFVTPVERITVETPERYSLQFRSDGRFSIRADCNRGMGSYNVGDDGRISFGRIALTRALCPPGSHSDRYVNELGRVTSYVLKGRELFLELPADSGTMRFRRRP
jgi:para-nitrobenzyl esterase